MKQSDLNHLRRLVAWVRCEIGQDPAEMVAMVQDIGENLGGISDYGKKALVEAHDKSRAVPQYVRAAVKALSKAVNEPGPVVADDSALEAPRRAQQDLTNEEILDIWIRRADLHGGVLAPQLNDFARAVLAAQRLKEVGNG